jgi:alkaline phosphatase D
MEARMDRRRFLGSALYFTVACAGSGLPASRAAAQSVAAPGTYSFPQGVASGDPRETSIVFWTRCLGPPGADVPLRLEVSASPAFDALVAALALTATALYDHTVRAKLTGLAPATRYYYRFVAGADASPAGQSLTAPAPSAAPPQVRFAWASCQDWHINHWAAFELLAQEEVDFVVHVGDYVYESITGMGRAEPAHPRIELPDGLAGDRARADSLEDYRTLYRTYRGDPRLQEVHRKFPMIAVWDDHEFSDDCWQDHETYDNANTAQPARRRNANQAWAEYMPVDFGDLSFDLANPAYDNIRIYRDFQFGSLVHLVMTDERLYRDDHVVDEAQVAGLLGHDPVNGNDRLFSRFLVPLDLLAAAELQDTIRLRRRPAILAPTQASWWKERMSSSPAQWKVWGNQVTLNRMWLDLRQRLPAPFDRQFVLDADLWDGYPSQRADLMGYLKNQGIGDVVAVTGDLHAFQCGVVRDNPDPSVGTPVMVDFVGAGISSESLFASLQRELARTPLDAVVKVPNDVNRLMRDQNPDLAYVDFSAQGYAVATVTAGEFSVVFNKVGQLNEDGSVPVPALARRTRIRLAAGTTVPVVEDNVM